MSWALKPFGDIASFKNGKSIKPGLSGEFPVYGANGIIGGANEWVYESSLILGRVGAYCGAVELCEGRFWPSDNTIVVQAVEDSVTLKFLYYLLKHADLNRYAGGAAQPLLTQSRLKPIEFLLPPLAVQSQIAAILSAYDDLIENNTRRIEILEEMARRLYEEWFVHYRFPEGLSALDAEKWPVERIGDVCTIIQSGGTPSRSKEEYWSNGIIDWYKTKELWDSFLFGSEERISSQALIDKKARVFPSGTIMMAIYGSPTVGRLGITTRESSCNQAALAMRPNENKVSFWVFYYTLFSLRDYFNSKAQGAAQQNISKEKVWETLIAIPDRQLQIRFDSIVDSIKAQVRVLVKSNINLRAQRDLLLPKLISGEIDVSDIPMPT
ncbi:restriction endonuclease subunit S [Stutzerimonas balearica]|uniref:restriction endonuclease subunit S n=1 Tax=Stutzerimonas balearica TaxID=74829 RepID=UPI003F7668C3